MSGFFSIGRRACTSSTARPPEAQELLDKLRRDEEASNEIKPWDEE